MKIKKKFLDQIQLNMFKFISRKYLNYIIDLIEIQNKNNSNEIINKYIKIIQNNDKLLRYFYNYLFKYVFSVLL